MKNRRLDGNLVPSQLRKIIEGMFGLDPGPPTVIPDDEALVGGSFGLDSLDGVELALCIEEEFGVSCGADVLRRGVGSIATLARYICAGGQIIQTAAKTAGPSADLLEPDIAYIGWGMSPHQFVTF